MIVFYWGAEDDHAGGVQNLILNISKACKHYGVKIKIITYTTSFVYKAAVEQAIPFTFIDARGDFAGQVNADDTLICFGSLELFLSLFVKTDASMIYWSVFPDTLVKTFQFKIPCIRNKFSKNNVLSRFFTKRLINQLHETSSAYFMDDSHLSVARHYYPSLPFTTENLLPIPIEIKQNFSPGLSKYSDKLKIGYMGRAEDWKIYPFIKLVEDIKSLGQEYKIEICIISENPNRYLSFMNELNINYSGIKFKMVEGVSGNNLTELLQKEIHVLFSHGTSLLEACKTGVPAIIIDAGYTFLPSGYLYRFLYEEKGYCLGHAPWILKREYRGYPLIDLFDMIFGSQKQYEFHCRKSYEYALNNHELNKWTERLIDEVLPNARLKIKDLFWAYRLLSIKRFFYNVFKIFSKN